MGFAAYAWLPQPWKFIGFSVFVLQILAALKVGRVVRPRVAPQDGQSFDVILVDAGPRSIETIKIVREFSSWTLEDAKRALQGVPAPLGLELSPGDAREMVERLLKAGASAHVQVAPPG